MARVISILTVSMLLTGVLPAADRQQDPADPVAHLLEKPDPIPAILRPLAASGKEDLSSFAAHEPDTIYGRKYGTALVMDVFMPKMGRNGGGVILVVSGALWSDPRVIQMPPFVRNVRDMIERGYVVFAVMHGCQPKYTYLDAWDDLSRAVRYVRHHAKRWGVQPESIGIMGWSSGGHLTLLVATTANSGDPHAEDPVDREHSNVQAAVAYFPNADLLNYGAPKRLMSEHFATFKLGMDAAFDFHRWDREKNLFLPLSDAQKRIVLRELSPLHHVTKASAPTLLFHGDQDPLVPIQQSEVFANRMKEVGAECRLTVGHGKGHGWDPPLPNEKEEIAKWFDRHLLRPIPGAQAQDTSCSRSAPRK
ncbi:MAG: alpha/beta hydrolase [Thermoguttaceae bacterium]|jgi:acetyl esterase/lipase|nr:alpha/beta hydrolase [Thermoguttaceae bacterium]